MYVYLLLEFQSTSERYMAARMLAYVSLLYQDLVRGEALYRRAGRKQGLDEGRKKGLEEGRKAGHELGRRDGEAQLLRRILEKRFGEPPDWVQVRLQQATLSQLEAWAEDVLAAPSLDALMNNRSGEPPRE